MAFVHVLTNISRSLRYREVWLDNRIVFTAGKWRKTGQPFVVKVVEELSFDGKVHLIKTNTVEGSVLLFRIDRAFHYIFILTRVVEFGNSATGKHVVLVIS